MADTRLDDLFPDWHFRERHRIAITGPTAEIMRAVEQTTWREVPVFRALMSVAAFGARAFGRQHDTLAAQRRILDQMTSDGFRNGGGFAIIDRTADELVVGVIGPFSKPASLAGYDGPPLEVLRAFDRPGYKAAMNFRHANGQLTTETRVLTTTARSRQIFRIYWAFIRIPSGLIRRFWLHGIRKHLAR